MYGVGFILLFLSIHQVAQHQLADGIADRQVRVVLIISLFQHRLQAIDQYMDIGESLFGHLVALAVLPQPGLIVDIGEHLADHHDRILDCVQLMDSTLEPGAETLQAGAGLGR